MLKIQPTTMRAANAFIQEHHRHNKPVQGCRFALSATLEGQTVGVIIVGRPVARLLDDGSTAEVTRCCTISEAPKGTNSFLYGKAKRAWSVMGGTRLVTYTLQSESGASLRGAGWNEAARTEKVSWDRPNTGRQRKTQAVYSEPKIRWEAPCL